MPPFGLALAVGVTLVFAAQSCDVGGTGFSIDDLTDHIVVTNASATQDVTVNVSTSLSSVDLDLPAGSSRTVGALTASKYTLEVFASDDPSGATYKQGLLDLRDKLVTLSLHPENPSADALGAVVELSSVETALQQMHADGFQTCNAAIKTGVDGKATVTWSASGLTGTGVWVLSCA
jgi:hypothetical protein